MELAMNRLQAISVNVCVDLGRRDAGMAEHFLHGAQIGSSGQKMCGEAVSEGVWADLPCDATPFHVLLYEDP